MPKDVWYVDLDGGNQRLVEIFYPGEIDVEGAFLLVLPLPFFQVHHNGLDLCDCLESLCPGCHNPCPRCESTKCGTECRSRRKWLYEHILVEGTENKIKNPAAFKGMGKNPA